MAWELSPHQIILMSLLIESLTLGGISRKSVVHVLILSLPFRTRVGQPIVCTTDRLSFPIIVAHYHTRDRVLHPGRNLADISQSFLISVTPLLHKGIE